MEDISEEEEIMNLPVGTNYKDLRVSKKTKTIWVAAHNKRWEIEYRDLSWEAIGECIDLANVAVPKKDGTAEWHFSQKKYYREALKRMIIKCPFPNLNQGLATMSREFGRQLEKIVPRPFEDGKIITEDDEKNSEPVCGDTPIESKSPNTQ